METIRKVLGKYGKRKYATTNNGERVKTKKVKNTFKKKKCLKPKVIVSPAPHGTSTHITLRMFYPNQITLMEERLLKIWMKHPNQLVSSFSDRYNI